jgi:hypothetical protein
MGDEHLWAVRLIDPILSTRRRSTRWRDAQRLLRGRSALVSLRRSKRRRCGPRGKGTRFPSQYLSKLQGMPSLSAVPQLRKMLGACGFDLLVVVRIQTSTKLSFTSLVEWEPVEKRSNDSERLWIREKFSPRFHMATIWAQLVSPSQLLRV